MKKIIFIIITLFFSHSYSQTWFSQYVSDTRTVYDIFFLNASTGWAALDSGYVLKTTNGGQNWDTYNIGNYSPVLKISFANANTGLAVVFFSQTFGFTRDKIYKTSNGGINWNLVTTPSDILDAQSISALNADTLTISGSSSGGKGTGNGGGLYKTFNGGTNFLTNEFSGGAIKIQIVNRTAWFWATRKSPSTKTLLAKSTNSGNNWISFPPDGDTNINVKDFYFLNENTGYVLSGSPVILLYKTNNGGANWTFTTPPANTSYPMQFINENTGWLPQLINVGSTELRLHKTTNSGANWNYSVVDNGNRIQRYVKMLFINENTGWLSGGTGLPYNPPNKGIILKTTNGGVTFTNTVSSQIPDKYSLSQNYPNPFNPLTRINYELPITNLVSLKVYDNLGNAVAILVNEKQNAGSYSVDFNASELPSGIYFYKLVTESFSETKKMVLVK